MSLGSEYLADHAYELEFEFEDRLAAIRRQCNAGIWVTKEGKALKICEMQTSHIKNCINFLKRKKHDFFNCYIRAFEEELIKRGDTE